MPDHRTPPASPFGRGWIPATREIGLPDEVEASILRAQDERTNGGILRQAQDERVSGNILRQAQDERVSDNILRQAQDERAFEPPLPQAGSRQAFAEQTAVGGGLSSSDFPADAAPDRAHPQAPSRLREGESASPQSLSAPSAAAREPNPHHDHFTPQRQVAFLAALAGCGSVRAACARIGISAQSAYLARRRHALFAAGWDAALVLARQAAEDVLAVRALDGVEEAVWYRVEVVGTRRRYDSRLLLAHLARLDGAAARSPRSAERAGRFDELLACLGGEGPPAALAPDPAYAAALAPPPPRTLPDPLLPPTREA